MLSTPTLNIKFCRSRLGNRWDKWLELVNRLMHISLSNTQDVFVWGLTSSGLFSVKSMYLDLINDQPKFTQKFIWKTKVPLKIKILYVVASEEGHFNKGQFSEKKLERQSKVLLLRSRRNNTTSFLRMSLCKNHLANYSHVL